MVPGIRGYKRIWRTSCGLKPGCWGYSTHALDDAIRRGPFEFDEEGIAWDYEYEEWVPINNDLRNRVWLRVFLRDEMTRRDEDYLNYLYFLLRNYIF